MAQRFPGLPAAAAALLLSACPQGTGDYAPGGGAGRLLAPSDQPAPAGDSDGYPEGGEEPEAEARLPPGHPRIDGKETSEQLLARVEAMKEQLRDRPRTMEIEMALGNLYLDNGRYLDAVDWYRQAVETAEPGWKRYLALPARSRSAPPSAEARRACVRSERAGYQELSALAEERARRGDAAGAAYCLRQALEPSLDARARRGNAWFLAGNADLGVADHEEVLRRDPSRTESLFFLGAILYDSAGEELERLRRARDAWMELRRRDPKSPRLKAVAEALPGLEEQIRNGGKRPAPPPAVARGAGPSAGPGEVSAGAAEAVAQMDVSDPAFWEAADRQISEGEQKLASGDYEGARELIKGMVPVVMLKARNSPYFKRVLADMGLAYLQLGNARVGRQMLTMALQQDPDYAPAREALAALDAGRPLPPFRPQGAPPRPSSPEGNVPAVPAQAEARQLRDLAARGEADFKKGDYAGAATAWKQVLSADPYLAGELGLRARIAAAEKRLGGGGGR